MLVLTVASQGGAPALAEANLPSRPIAWAYQESPATQAPTHDAIDADELPISVVRIRQRLAELPPTDPKSDLRLNYYIEVYGHVSELDIFTGIDLSGKGGVQYGSPTHREFLDIVTPQEFRAPVMDLGSLLFAASTWATKRAIEKRKEAERRRIQAEAQRLRSPG
ncbi:MAG: hypothetical protein U0Q12_20175 [Vicinamibacterales bacterium]